MVTWLEKQWLSLTEVIQFKCYFRQSVVQLYFALTVYSCAGGKP